MSESDEDFGSDGRAAWLDEPSQEVDDFDVDEYDIVSSPNDWNFLTIVSFIESGAVKIPAFQRNYVWDIKRASKLIESLLLGLPVPQVFLYEQGKNDFLVIDGQQRLLSLYFFAKQRFPKPGSRAAVRALLNEGKGVSEDALRNDDYFGPFRLALPKTPTGKQNKFHGLTVNTLDEYKTSLDLRTIRNVVVKQVSPTGDSAIFEIFSRLNSGGVNLSQQEIRASLYHSDLMARVQAINAHPEWRAILGVPTPDARMRDSEVILRALALARDLEQYAGSMTAFVNRFCVAAQRYTDVQVDSADADFMAFLREVAGDSSALFSRGGKFSGVLFESFFAAWVREGKPALGAGEWNRIVEQVKTGEPFAATLQEGSTKTVNVTSRVSLAAAAIASA